MADMLVKLYDLPELEPVLAALKRRNIEIYRDIPAHKGVVVEWVRQRFNISWASGCDAAYSNRPPTVWIAVEHLMRSNQPSGPYDLSHERLVGFACADCDYKGIFGPTGVREDYRGHGIGTGLLLACLHGMAADGYAYAVIHWAGPVDFYVRTVGATLIPDSEPAFARGWLET